jgi:putative ABC transport system ATP-binding protein
MANDKPPIAVITNLAKSYRRGSQVIPVLQDITLDIAEGEFLALMGPSGSGKSTLLNLIAGIDKADTGRIAIGGVDITTLAEADLAAWRAANVGFIFQFYNLMPVLTAFENVELPLLLTPLSRKERQEHVETALGLVNLTDRMDHYPSQLSGGQQQRVAIARALVNQPRVLLADEPTGNLDTRTSEEVMAVFQDLNERGKTVVVITHEQDISEYAKRVVMFRDGKLVEDHPVVRRRAATAMAAGETASL